MAERLTTRFWIDAYLLRLSQEGVFAHIAARGDATAGAVLVKCATMDGQACLYQRSFDPMTGERGWVVLREGAEREVDESVARQREFDPDLWVIEVEDPRGRHLLEEDGFA